jgi:5-(carboxyamino)imidazole ribonucleotide mutase
MKRKTQIGIVLGSYSDVKRMEPGMKRLQSLEVPFEMCIASAHRTPERLIEWLDGAEKRGVRVIIAGAGAAAHLPGVVASKTVLPVIGVPFNASPIEGIDALYSIVQMPPGIPVATVGIDGAENSVILALHILATTDPDLRRLLISFRADWKKKIAEQNEKLYQDYPQARPTGTDEAVSNAAVEDLPPSPVEVSEAGTPELFGDMPTGEGDTETDTVPARGRVLRVDGEQPDLLVVEEVVEVLRQGGVIALPTDTVYGLAADATNEAAVARLFEIKGRSADKAIPVLIDSDRLLHRLVDTLPEGIEEVLDKHWPGALTLVVPKRPRTLPAIGIENSIAIRMPDNMLALGLINLLGQALATTSANRSGEAPATTAQEVADTLGNEVDLILDCGPTPGQGVSTILSVVSQPYEILRQGVLERDALKEILGDLLAG